MTNTLVVLAAGIGSRYGGLKQMDPVGPAGEFILDYSVYDAIRAGFGKVVFVISRAIEEAFRETLGTRLGRHAAVDYVVQDLADASNGFRVPGDRKKPWGTGHAVLACRHAVNGPFGVINADDFYGRESYAVLADFLSRTAGDPNRHAMVGYLLRKTVSEHGAVARGICRVGADHTLVEIVERTRIETHAGGIRFADGDGTWHALTGDEPASMNLWGFKPSLFEVLRTEFRAFLGSRGTDPKAEFFVPSVVNLLIEQGRASVEVLTTSSPWFGVTYPQDKPRVVAAIRALIAAGEYPADLWA